MRAVEVGEEVVVHAVGGHGVGRGAVGVVAQHDEGAGGLIATFVVVPHEGCGSAGRAGLAQVQDGVAGLLGGEDDGAARVAEPVAANGINPSSVVGTRLEVVDGDGVVSYVDRVGPLRAVVDGIHNTVAIGIADIIPTESGRIGAEADDFEARRAAATGVGDADVVEVVGVAVVAIDAESHIELAIGIYRGGVRIDAVFCPSTIIATLTEHGAESGDVQRISHKTNLDIRAAVSAYFSPEGNFKAGGVGAGRHGGRDEVMVVIGIEVHASRATVRAGGANIVGARGTSLYKLPANGVGTGAGRHTLEAFEERQCRLTAKSAYTNAAPTGFSNSFCASRTHKDVVACGSSQTGNGEAGVACRNLIGVCSGASDGVFCIYNKDITIIVLSAEVLPRNLDLIDVGIGSEIDRTHATGRLDRDIVNVQVVVATRDCALAVEGNVDGFSIVVEHRHGYSARYIV